MTTAARISILAIPWLIFCALPSGCSTHSTQTAKDAPLTSAVPSPESQTPKSNELRGEITEAKQRPAKVLAPSNTIESPHAEPSGADDRVTEPLQVDSTNLKRLDELYLMHLSYGGSSLQFQKALQGLCDDTPELPADTGSDSVRWHSIGVTPLSRTMNKGNHLIALFKFRSPLTQPADLHWSFAVPGALGEWYIVPAKGAMKGFESFKIDRSINVPAVHLPSGSLFVFQELLGGKILPGEDYVIWYIPPDGADKQMFAALKLTPTGTHAPGKTAAEIRQILGVEASPQKISNTESGIRDAYESAHRMVHFKPQDKEGLKHVLRSIWDQLPEIQVASKSGVPIWNHLTPDVSFRFHAVRFKSSFDQAADLNWSYVVDNDQLQWGFVSKEGEIEEPNSYGVELNCPIPGITNSDKNLAVFQKLANGQIRPGVEYAIWFAPVQAALPDFDVAVRLSPSDVDADTAPQTVQENEFVRRIRTEVHPIAHALGLEIPATPSSDRVAAALESCRRMIVEGKERSWLFNSLLEFAAPVLPQLESGGDHGHWNRIELNRNGNGLVAYRVDMKESQFGRMILAVARPNSVISQFNLPIHISVDASRQQIVPKPPILTWGTINTQWPGIYLPYRFSKDDVTALGLAIPRDSAIDIDVYSDLTFPRDNQCIVVFSPPDTSPMTLHVAVKVEDKPTTIAPTNVSTAMDYMGFDNTVVENQGKVLGKHRAPISMVKFGDNGESLISASSYSFDPPADAEIKWWNVPESKEIAKGAIEFMDVVRGVSNDQTRFATVNGDARTIAVYQGRPLKRASSFKLPDERIPQTLCFSPDGNWLLTCHGGNDNDGSDGVVRKCVISIWNLKKDEPPQKHEYPTSKPIRTACWLPDGRIVTGGSRPPSTSTLLTTVLGGISGSVKIPLPMGEVQFFDGSNFKPENSITQEGADWSAFDISADGSRLGALARSGWVTVLDIKTGQSIASLPVGISRQHISLSDDGHRLVTSGYEGDFQIWDLDLMRTLSCGSGRMPPVYDAAISPNGDKIAAGGRDGKIRLYTVSTPQGDKGRDLEPLVLTDSIGLRMNWIPSGDFMMGRSEAALKNLPQATGPSNPRELAQLPRHAVHFGRPFYLGRFEVTVAQFRQFVEATGYRTTAETTGKGGSHILKNSQDFTDDPKLNWKNPGFPQQDNHPVVQVSYFDAIAFCEWLSKKEQVKYRLPTEAEWEYTCRAGTTTMFYHGTGNWMFRCSNIPDGELIKAYGGQFNGAYGNSDGNAFTAPVGSYVPNGFGLFDMHGNVWEWCSDWYDANYFANSPLEDPTGPAAGTDRVQRGGSFLVGPSDSAWRDFGPPDQVQSSLGFRVVREIP